MKVVFISPDFKESLAFQGDFSIVEGFTKFRKERDMSKKSFIKAYGDWQVYYEHYDPTMNKLIGNYTVKDYIE